VKKRDHRRASKIRKWKIYVYGFSRRRRGLAPGGPALKRLYISGRKISR